MSLTTTHGKRSSGTARRQPLTVWELPSLLTPVHRRRRTTSRHPLLRPHFHAILSFVYRNRYAVASQIQRRFADKLRSDRTTRRHLAELEELRLLGVVSARSVGPLFPKVYYVTGRGVRTLRQAFAPRGTTWTTGKVDRRGRHASEGHSADHVLHEIFVTEFLLAVWQTVHGRPDLELPTIQRRSLARHPAFQIRLDRSPMRLIPDAFFVFRQVGGGMMACFLEMDMGSMTKEQLKAKLRRYEAWSRSAEGRDYLLAQYDRFGAANPRPVFRIIIAAQHRDGGDGTKRMREICDAAGKLPKSLQRCLWLTTVHELRSHQNDSPPLANVNWRRPLVHSHATIADGAPLFPRQISHSATCVPASPTLKLGED
ncbi:MAG: replication-relaxation family protein [Planctomycetes bacterium]|nr:replication-relaxation family protein [Planctomycetota bacterium]